MRLSRFLIFVGTLALVVAVAGALLLPWVIDTPLMKQKISSHLTKKTGGAVALDKIAVLWFPRPTVVVDNAKISFGATTHGTIRTVKIYPSIVSLFTGRVVVRQVLLQEPRLSIHVPDGSGRRFDLELWEEQVRAALVRLIRELPSPRVDLSAGSAEIRIGDHAPMVLMDVTAQTAGSSDEVRFELSTRSNLCDRLKVEGKIFPESLESQLNIGLQQFKIRETLTLLAPQIAGYVQQGEATLTVKTASVGLRNVKASVGGSIGPFVLVRNNGSARIDVQTLKGGIAYEGGALHVDVENLELGSPRLKASGGFKFQAGLLSARVRVRDFEIADVSELALRIVGDSDAVHRIVHHVPAGTVAEMNFQSAGRSFTEMAAGQNIAISASMRDGRILIPRFDLEFENVGGSIRIAHGILEADSITGNLGTAKGWNGKLRLGLEGKSVPFHLDIRAQSGARDVQALLLKTVHDELLRGELLKLRNVSGELAGRLVLGDSLDAISPVVTISRLAMSAIYEQIPFPIEIRRGRFSYDQRFIKLENAQGSVGRSVFDGLAVSLDHDGSRRVSLDSARISLDLQETEILLQRFKDVRARFAEFQSARGVIELEKFTLVGAYDDPAAWIFASAGTFHQLEISRADFPGPITVSRGKFTAKQEKADFSDTTLAIADVFWVGGGTFEYLKEAPRLFVTSGMGTIGAQMTQWLSDQVDWPEGLKLRSPLKVAAERLAWRADGNISFHGQVTAAGGPQLSLVAVKNPQRLSLPNLTLDDGDQRARASFQLAKRQLGLAFSGELRQQTIDKIFASFPTQISALSGEIQLSVSLEPPMRLSAQGQLHGNNLWLPLGTEKALVEQFSIEASGQSLLVRSADLRWGKSRITAAGKIDVAERLLRVDLDVASDQLDWQDLRRPFVGKDNHQQQERPGAVSFPGVEGTIRLKTNRFAFERFNSTAFETTARISSSGIKAEIDQAVVCGINVTGRVDAVGGEIGIDLQLAARRAQLEPTTVCLTNRPNHVTGTYSLTAHVLARGERDQLLRTLQGNFEISAADGEFIRSPAIDATFDYLNTTGDFKVAFPDLDRQTLPYRRIAIKGRIDGEILVGDEVNIASSMLNLSGQGKVDLERAQIDGKGLISVLKPINEVISRIPGIGSMLGGSLLGIPVRVSGALKRPDVTYLSPADVGVELLNIPLRILGIPIGAMRLFTPRGDLSEKNVAN